MADPGGPQSRAGDAAEQMAVVLGASPDGFLVLDEAGLIRYASPGCEQFVGISPQRLLGQSPFAFLDPDWAEELAAGMAEMLDAGESGGNNRILMRLVDGSTIPVELAVRRIDDPEVGALAVQLHAVPGARPLDQFLEALATSEDVSELLRSAMDLAVSDTPADACTIHYRWRDGDFAERVSVGIPDEVLEQGDAHDGPLPWHRAAEQVSATVVPSLDELGEDFGSGARAAGFRSLSSIPVPDTGEEVVVLTLWSTSESRLTFGNRLAVDRALRMTALAFEHQRSAELLRYAAAHDPLTGAPNRAHFIDHLETSFEAEGECCALLYLDLDDFKDVNDRFGHPVGDVVLRTVVDRLERELRDDDVVARVGGDEFAVVCPGVSEVDEAVGIAERLRVAVAQPMAVDDRVLDVGVSVGVGLSVASPTGEHLIRLADDALLSAKRRGKGRWELAPGQQ